MNKLFAAALEVQSFCAERRWKLAVIGGLAVQRWGEPRQTRDVDITLLTGLGGEEVFVDALLGHFLPRLPDARQFALERRVVLVETGSGIPIDISLGGLPYEQRVIESGARGDATTALRQAHDVTVMFLSHRIVRSLNPPIECRNRQSPIRQ